MTDDNKKSRTEYQREWRYTHPENVRANKITSYWNNPEKHRKRARTTWHKNKGSTEKGKVNDNMANNPIVLLAPTQLFRMHYIRKHARELYDKLKVDPNPRKPIYPIYKQVKQAVEMFQMEVIVIIRQKGGYENMSEQEVQDIAAKYKTLTFPFDT